MAPVAGLQPMETADTEPINGCRIAPAPLCSGVHFVGAVLRSGA